MSDENKYEEEYEELDVDGFMIFVCIFFPFVAWMLYAFNAAKSPQGAKKCMITSLVSMAIMIAVAAVALL